MHLDGYNQLPHLISGAESPRETVFYYEGMNFQTVPYRDWKAHFVIQDHGWFGPRFRMTAHVIFNLRRDPYEKARDESGMYVKWAGDKMWVMWPLKKLVQEHMAIFKDFPTPGQLAETKQKQQELERLMREESGFAQ